MVFGQPRGEREVGIERKELREQLEKVLQDKSIGIVLLTEKFGREFPDILDEFRLERKIPLLIEIPDRHGTGLPKHENILFEILEQILFGGQIEVWIRLCIVNAKHQETVLVRRFIRYINFRGGFH